ncbi:MAG: hypothetical protein C0624_10755 [Desulfuromonas sp.]|nr:MAG: hypothetical protein C0624_10755 [Desulfuromonas sp.]
MKFTDNTILTPPENIASRETENGLCILNLETGEHYEITGIGDVIWKLISDGKSFGEIVQSICDTYTVDQSQAKNDLANFAAGLIQKGVLAE